MLNNLIGFSENPEKATFAVNDAKNTFGENTPYVVERRLGEKILIFDEHFINALREALSNGCMAKMNVGEVEIFERYLEYAGGSYYRDITMDEQVIMSSLDEWLVRLVGCARQPKANECFDNEHTWQECENKGK